MQTKLEFHEYANLFPLMNGDEFATLVEDMRINGYDTTAPIVTCQGKILDGRNRYNASFEAGIEPVFQEFKGTDALGFVIRHNLKRRHLTASQRAAVAVDVESYLSKAAKENMRSGGGDKKSGFEKIQNPIQPIHAAKQAAKLLGTNEHYVVDAKKLKEQEPRVFEQVLAGNLSLQDAKKEVRAKETKAQRAEMANQAKSVRPSDRWNVYQADMRTWNPKAQYDFVITDPPYPREFVPLYENLACRSEEWLKEGGLLVAMCGQSYLDEIFELMSKSSLRYYWTAAYLTPGQPTPLRQRQVNTTWKPLLMFSKGEYKGKIFGDVFKSDANDKEFHKWGQSISGMYSIVSGICLPGQRILDPFCGAGTTGVASLMHNCLFDGIEQDAENANISKARLHDAAKKGQPLDGVRAMAS
jgi:16S rRNA G966 N2-methylase RsmD